MSLLHVLLRIRSDYMIKKICKMFCKCSVVWEQPRAVSADGGHVWQFQYFSARKYHCLHPYRWDVFAVHSNISLPARPNKGLVSFSQLQWMQMLACLLWIWKSHPNLTYLQVKSSFFKFEGVVLFNDHIAIQSSVRVLSISDNSVNLFTLWFSCLFFNDCYLHVYQPFYCEWLCKK